MIFEFRIPYDVLVAAVNDIMKRVARGFANVHLEPEVGASIVMRISQDQLGDVCEIRIRKLREDLSEIFIRGPVMPNIRAITAEDRQPLEPYSGPERREHQLALLRRLEQERDELRQKRKEHTERIAGHVIVSLQDENIWLGDTPEPITKVIKRGPQRYSDKEKLDALREWDKLDKAELAIRLEDFLLSKFGDENGSLRVAVSTFHGWRRALRKKGKYAG